MKKILCMMLLAAAAMAQTTIVAGRINTERFANQFASIQAAITDAGTTGSVRIPASYTGTDSYTNPNKIPIVDMRGGAAAYRGCVSPKDMGAKFDGVTDDRTAIQAAHDAAVANGFAAVCFPAGTYKVVTALNWSPYIQAISYGRVTLTTALASGTFINISDQYGRPSPDPGLNGTTRTKVFSGIFIITNTNGANTARTFLIGGASASFFASEVEVINGMVVEGFNGGVFQLGYGAFLIHISNFMGIFNKGAYFSVLAGATGSGENISIDNSVFSQISDGTATAYLMSLNTALDMDFNFTNCSFDYLFGINDPAQTALLAQVNFTNSHFEWNTTGAPYISLNNGIQMKITNAKFFSGLSASFSTPFVGQVQGGSTLSVINARYEFGGTVPKLYDLTSSGGTLTLDQVLSSANAVTTYYTYNSAGRLVLMGRDVATDIGVGSDVASTSFVGKSFTTAHSASNVPSEMDYGIKEGGAMNGVKVKNVRDGSFNSDSIEFAVQHGGVSLSTAMVIDKDGQIAQNNLRSGVSSNTDLTGKITLAAGSGSYTFTKTYATAPVCLAQDDTTATNAVTRTVTTTTLTLTGTGTDTVSYICTGRN